MAEQDFKSILDSFSVSLLKEADENTLAKLALDGFKASEPGAEFIEKAKAKEALRDNPEMAEEIMISFLKSPEFLSKIEDEGPDSAVNFLVSKVEKDKEESEDTEGAGEEEATFESLSRLEKIKIIENKALALAEKNKCASNSSGEENTQNKLNLLENSQCLASLGSLQIMTEDQLRNMVRKIILNNF